MIGLSIYPMQRMLLCYHVTKINLQANIWLCLALANTWDYYGDPLELSKRVYEYSLSRICQAPNAF